MATPIKQLLTPAVATGLVAGVSLTTPEIITQVIGFIFSFAASLALLLLLVRLAPVASWRMGVQRLAIWLVAAFGACAVHSGVFFRR